MPTKTAPRREYRFHGVSMLTSGHPAIRAVKRTDRVGQAWRYTSAVGKAAMVRKEIGSLLETLFDGSAKPLVSHLAEMDALDLDDLKALEERLAANREEDA